MGTLIFCWKIPLAQPAFPFTLNPADIQGVEHLIIRLTDNPDHLVWEYEPEAYHKVMDEFELKATEHRNNLKSLYEKIKDVDMWDVFYLTDGIHAIKRWPK